MKLKSVSYAVLGQLAFRSWAAYELVKEMKRNFHYFYPKAESGLYEELKKLERVGLVTSQMKVKGKKERTVYTITTEGKQQLEEWLLTEPDHYSLEFEGLLRVFLSKFGQETALQHALFKVRTDNDVLIELAENVGNEYLSDTAPAQSEIVERAIIFDFLLHYGMMYKEWLLRTEQYLGKVKNMPKEEAIVHAKGVFESFLKQFGMRIRSTSPIEHSQDGQPQ